MTREILSRRVFAVAGVSRDPSKFGYKVHRYLVSAGYEVYAVNPNADCVEDAKCYPTVADLPVVPEVVVTVTQPWVTSGILKQSAALGVPFVWMQPGSEPRAGIPEAEAAGTRVYRGCIMVEHSALRFR